ncbi:hypothetical protein BX600DRAFT_552972 [Xylariales sp. PMI_506]|nr:hypothetical protein BX600DRAFT_552972 [Xylariales sp. PMI_506]
MAPPQYPWPQKAIRKGTHSCVECRRRKRRCYFEPGATTCSACGSRGRQCIEQTTSLGAASSVQQAAVQLERINALRPPDLPKQQPLLTRQGISPWMLHHDQHHPPDGFLQDEGIDPRVPLVSTLNDAQLLRTMNPELPTDPAASRSTAEGEMDPANAKAKTVCEIMRKALPSYDTVMLVLTGKGAWLTSFQKKLCLLSGVSQTVPRESFAARAYTSGDPGELGSLLVAFAQSSSGYDHLFSMVEALVISDFNYLATLKGMECLSLFAKTHLDNGQPRKAWLLWRRGMAVAQLMGWYQTSTTSPAQRSLWWDVYQCDRLISLLLGLPYGFNDAHYGDILDNMVKELPSPVLAVIIRTTFISGKVIDRNLAGKKLSLTHAIDLDEQMAALVKMLPDEWWEVPADPRGPDVDPDELEDRLTLQFFFFHLWIYVHLPLIGHGTPADPSFDISRFKCMRAARELLRRFIILRSEAHGFSSFECKTTDFMSFTAVLALLICRFRVSETGINSYRLDNEDAKLVLSMQTIFKNLEDKGCKIAAQCRGTLQFLIADGDPSQHGTISRESGCIRIPYFGTVIRRSLKPDLKHQFTPTQNQNHSESRVEAAAPDDSGHAPLLSQYSVEYEGLEMVNPFLDNVQCTSGGNNGDYFHSLAEASMIDIDHDWAILYDLPASESNAPGIEQ